MSEDTTDADLSPDQSATLAEILDALIPARADGVPGAGALGLAASVADAVQRTPGLLPLLARGLEALRDLARQRDPRGLDALTPEQRRDLLHAAEAAVPALLPALVFHAYAAYYRHPRVLEALGLEARPPFPDGYEQEPNDLSLLDTVRRRPKLYRSP